MSSMESHDGASSTNSLYKQDREPWLAGLWSMAFPGLGQLYARRSLRAAVFSLCFVVTLGLGVFEVVSCGTNTIVGFVLIAAALLAHVVAIIEAVYVSKKGNSQDFEVIRRSKPDPFYAVFLSAIFPGLGHMILLRRWARGAILFFLALILNFATLPIFPKFLTQVFWAFVAFDAFAAANERRVSSLRLISAAVPIVLLSIESLAIDKVFSRYDWGTLQIGIASGASGLPEVEPGDVIVTNASEALEFSRGDLVSIGRDFRFHGHRVSKRVVAFAGENVEITGGKVFVNGEELSEYGFGSRSYFTDSACVYALPGRPSKVPDGHVFVLGDNSLTSRDSRHVGPIPMEIIEGINCKVIWPPWRIKHLRHS
jgi:signal peptidase I